jgi:UDPglucose 6-dehydrogenase
MFSNATVKQIDKNSNMKVTIFGSGYVGLVTGACFADVGHDVVCVDVDAAKIAALKLGNVPIHEPGLDAIIARNQAAGRLHFTTDASSAIAHGEVQFIAVGTPPGEDGSADLKYVLAVAQTIGEHLNHYAVVVTKSTVPVGTSDKVATALGNALRARNENIPTFAVASNPEFLREGAAIIDFMKPSRIVVGAPDPRARALLDTLYAPFTAAGALMLHMDVRSAELTKYACNAMLATRISFMNDLANLSELLGADIESVKQGIGSDFRIGPHFLNAGCGYGGSCFPKDVKALMRTANEVGYSLRVVEAVESVNETQKQVLGRKIVAKFGENLTGKHFAIWGLAFKPDTDDMREASSLVLIDFLLVRGATIAAYDPVAMKEAARVLGNRKGLRYGESAVDVARGAHAVIVVTEWKEFIQQPLDAVRAVVAGAVIIDGRNCIESGLAKAAGFEYMSLGRFSVLELTGM